MISPGDHDPLLVLLFGLAFDALFGDLPAVFAKIPHPIVLAGRAIAFFERKLNRASRSDRSRRERGIVTVVVLVALAAAVGGGIEWLCRATLTGAAVEGLLVGLLLAQRGLYEHVRAVAIALERGGLAAGREAVRHIVGRDPLQLDAHAVARAAIESLAENFSDAVVAPAFWYLLVGLPGLFAYKMANTLDSMIGHRALRYRAFGWAAARLDDVLNLLPARLSGVVLGCAALFAGGGNAARAFATMLRDAGKHHSPNAGWPEAAMAGALGLALAGPRDYGEERVEDPWIGSGTPLARPAEIASALHLYALACFILAGLILGAWLAAHAMRLG